MIEIQFKDVGRLKKSWKSTCKPNVTAAEMEIVIAREAKRNGSIASHYVDAEITEGDAGGGTGNIYVGGFRCIGTFTYARLT